MRIKKLHAREILDSRGNPTIEVDLLIDDSNSIARAAVPSGASVGSKEALELRDNNPKRYAGKGVLTAVDNVNRIISANANGKIFNSQEDFDNFLIDLDGTKNKSNLGANSILGCSMAFARAMALTEDKQLYEVLGNEFRMPRPMFNIINGGVHADNGLAIQEFMIIPNKFSSFTEALRTGAEIFHTLKKSLHKKGFSANVGDEGGFAPNFRYSNEALDFILGAIDDAGYSIGEDVSLALDVAASEFFEDNNYLIDNEKLSSDDLVDYYGSLIKNYPITSIEDPFSEFDNEGWAAFSECFRDDIQIVGDDLFVTNINYLKDGITNKIANAILIKLNQIGTVTETINTIDYAHQNGYNTIISHRSGETEDTFISHLAVSSGSWQIKSGSLCRSDRIAKYNELLRLEELF